MSAYLDPVDAFVLNTAKRLESRKNPVNIIFVYPPHTAASCDIMIIPAGALSLFGDAVFVKTPVIAYGSLSSLRSAFLAGCCDFIKLPLTPDELYFRILKNADPEDLPLVWGPLQITSEYIIGETGQIFINHQQFLILKMLLRNTGTPVSRESFQYMLWGSLKESSRGIDMHISIIRRKLASLDSRGCLIRTIRNFGYMIEKDYCG